MNVCRFFLILSLLITSAQANEQKQDQAREARAIASIHLLDEIVKGVKTCDKKVNFEQRLALTCASRVLRHTKWAEEKSKAVMVEIKGKIKNSNDQDQVRTHSLRKVSATESKNTLNKKREFNFVDRICWGLLKFRAGADIKNEAMYFNQCVTEYEQERDDRNKSHCEQVVEDGYQYLTGSEKGSFLKDVATPMSPSDRKEFVKKAKKRLVSSVVDACGKKKVRGLKKDCGQLIDEMEENRVDCRDLAQMQKKSRESQNSVQGETTYNNFDMLINIFVSAAYADMKDEFLKGNAEEVRADIINSAGATTLNYESSPQHRRSLYKALQAASSDADYGYKKESELREVEVQETEQLIQALDAPSQGLGLELYSSNYKIGATAEELDLATRATLTGGDKSSLRSMGDNLSPFGFGASKLTTFVNDLNKSAFGKKFPNPELERKLFFQAKDLNKALKKARDPLDLMKDKKTSNYLKKRDAFLASAFKKAIKLDKLASLPKSVIGKSQKSILDSIREDELNVDQGLAASEGESGAANGLSLKGGKGDMTEEERLAKEKNDAYADDEFEDGEYEADPYGFALSDDPDMDKAIKKQLLASKADGASELGYSEETGRSIWVQITNRYKKSGYKYLLRKRKKKTKRILASP